MTNNSAQSSPQVHSTSVRRNHSGLRTRARNLLALSCGAVLALTGLGAVVAPAAQAAATDVASGVIYTDDGSVITIVGCAAACDGASVVIPSTINGLPVTKVATDGWTQTGQIASLTIPSSVTTFGASLNGTNIVSIVFSPELKRH